MYEGLSKYGKKKDSGVVIKYKLINISGWFQVNHCTEIHIFDKILKIVN